MRPRSLPIEASSLILLLSPRLCSSLAGERVPLSATVRSLHQSPSSVRPLSLPVRRRNRPRRCFVFEDNPRRSATRHSHYLWHARGRHSHSWELAASAEGERDEEGRDKDGLLKWERMYYDGANKRSPAPVSESVPSSGETTESCSALGFPPPDDAGADINADNALARCQIRVVTFDLDNTVWRTDPTIAAANDALASFLMTECGKSSDSIAIPRVENVMKDMFRADPERYGPKKLVEMGSPGSDDRPSSQSAPSAPPATSPVQLTMLRKDAIRNVLNSASLPATEIDETVDRAFEHWVRARHAAIGGHLADQARECLEEISRIRTSEGHSVLIGAITDGNSDPSLVEGLEPFFDFCVNAERVGRSKPDPLLYLEAASSHVLPHPSLRMVLSALTGSSATQEDAVPAEDLIGPWWVHVGDDFIKDVVASKSLKMRSVWCRELVGKEALPSRSFLSLQSTSVSTSTRTVEDLVREVSEMKVVRMEVGSDDYLADAVRREFADAVVDRFADLVPLLRSWHDEGLDQAGGAEYSEAALKIASISQPKAVDPLTPQQPQAASRLQPPVTHVSQSDTKFCIHCGEKLPALAKFCSACGQKQI